MPTYNNMIPQPTDILSDSQDDILENFQVLATAFAVNHGPYNENAPFPEGTHTQVTLPNNVAPTPTTIATANIWSAQSPNSMTTELYWQRENVGSVIQWTGGFSGVRGWTQLPSGILIKWGSFVPTGNPFVVVFPTMDSLGHPIPAFLDTPNNPFNIQLTCNDAAGRPIFSNVQAGLTTNLQFQANTFLSNTGAFVAPSTVVYVAIGSPA